MVRNGDNYGDGSGGGTRDKNYSIFQIKGIGSVCKREEDNEKNNQVTEK